MTDKPQKATVRDTLERFVRAIRADGHIRVSGPSLTSAIEHFGAQTSRRVAEIVQDRLDRTGGPSGDGPTLAEAQEINFKALDAMTNAIEIMEHALSVMGFAMADGRPEEPPRSRQGADLNMESPLQETINVTVTDIKTGETILERGVTREECLLLTPESLQVRTISTGIDGATIVEFSPPPSVRKEKLI